LCMSVRWAPPLPTLGGRAGPRSWVEPSSTYLHKLEVFYHEHSSCSSVFERGLDLKFFRYLERRYGVLESPFRLAPDGATRAKRLGEFSPDVQYLVLSKGLYFKASSAFLRRMKNMLYQGKLGAVKQWFYTADAVILPYLLTCESPEDSKVDRLSKFALENCANNYSHFLKQLKSFKKGVRKAFATNTPAPSTRVMRTYSKALYSLPLMGDRANPAEAGRLVLTWTQTRASGLADSGMIRQSLKKLEETVKVPLGPAPSLDPSVLHETVKGFWKASGTKAKISVGSTSCLEFTRQNGGKTSMFRYLCSHKVLTRSYDPVTLEEVAFPARSCRSAQDITSWAIGWVLDNPILHRVRRAHAVAEPSKARTIGVPPYATTVLYGVCAHIVAPTLTSQGVRSGLKASRHLWNFLRDNLSPQNLAWEDLSGGRVYALSTDEETATDFGDLRVSDQIWSAFLDIAKKIDGFPVGLFRLCRLMYKRSRIYLFRGADNNSYRWVISTRGWPMGDMFTKVILTIVNDYCCRLSGLRVYSLVGDDIIALSNLKEQLEWLLLNLRGVGMVISDDDTYISHQLAFYCEEGTIVPQRVTHVPRVQMRRGVELFYLDYPRIRLLIPTQSETDVYSSSNVGRFSLLGKETLWVNKNNAPARELFNRASVIQHIIVPADKDLNCPFTPIEIGGDGSFPMSPQFLKDTVQNKSRLAGPNETKFRLLSLLSNKFRHKLVRSDKFDAVIHKHHIYLDKVEKLEALLPPAAVIRPVDDNRRTLLNSVVFPSLEKPTQTFMRLCKEVYYKYIFAGRVPPEPTFNLSRSFGPRNTKVILSFERFWSTWMDPGFIYHDFEPYMVDKDYLVPLLSTGLGWSFRRIDHIPTEERWEDWVRENVLLRDQNFDDLLRIINTNSNLPPKVADRLSEYFVSDVYVKSRVDVESDKSIVIITRDIKLCFEIHNFVNLEGPKTFRRVFALDPMLYLVGRLDEALDMTSDMYDVIEDAGSIIHCDFTEFEAGSPLTVSEDDLFIGEIIKEDSRFTPWVRRVHLRRTIPQAGRGRS